MTTGLKYVLLLLPTHGDNEQTVRQLLPGMISWRGKVSDLIDATQVAHWRSAVGTLNWQFMHEECRMVFVSGLSNSAADFDEETEALRQRVGIASNAMLLAGPNQPYYGVARCLTGEALHTNHPVRLKTIRGKSDVERIERPYYDQRLAFVRHFVETERLLKDRYLDRWAELVPLLDQLHRSGMPRTLDRAFTAFQTALTRGSVDFAIPEFIRSVECIVGLSKGMGAVDFAHRSMHLAVRLRKHWYVGGDGLQSRVKQLYGLRSDLVHGKVPFEALLSTGPAGEDEVARFGFLAEALARECLLWVLKNQQHHHLFIDRDTLEDAWATNKFPGWSARPKRKLRSWPRRFWRAVVRWFRR